MPLEAALAIAGAILVGTLIGIIAFTAAKRRAAQEEEMKRAASARGWHFESKTEKGFRIHRWMGTTDGIAWKAESLRQVSGGKNERRRQIARWQGDWSPGINGAIVCVGLPKGKDALPYSIAEGDGFFAKLAQKAAGFALDKALDNYFGDEAGKQVDAGALHRLDGATPGFVVMSLEKTEGARIMRGGLEQALVDAAGDQTSVLSDDKRPWVLLRPSTISLGRMERFGDVNEVEGFMRAGIALTKTSKFHRPFV